MPAFERACDRCGTNYTAKRKTSRFCSDRCRVAHRRKGGDAAPAAAEQPAAEAHTPPASTAVHDQVFHTLEAVTRTATVEGQAALALARSIDRGDEKGSALAALIREMRRTLELALEGTAPKQEPREDELKRRRLARRQSAG